MLVRELESRRGEISNLHIKMKKKRKDQLLRAPNILARVSTIQRLSSTREESAEVLSRLKCKTRTATVGRGEGSKTQEMIADEQFETTKPHTCGMANDRRTQLQPKIRTFIYIPGHILSGTTIGQHSTEAADATNGRHIKRLPPYQRGQPRELSYLTAVPPLPPIDIDNQ